MVELTLPDKPQVLSIVAELRPQEVLLNKFLLGKRVTILPQTHPEIIPDFARMSDDTLGSVFGPNAENARRTLGSIESYLVGHTALYPDFPNHDERRIWVGELEKSFPSEEMLHFWRDEYERKNQIRRNVIAGVTQGFDMLARSIPDRADPRREAIKELQQKINSALQLSDDPKAIVRAPDEYDLKPIERKLEIVQMTLTSIGEVFHLLFPQLTTKFPDSETREKEGIPEKVIYLVDIANHLAQRQPVPALAA